MDSTAPRLVNVPSSELPKRKTITKFTSLIYAIFVNLTLC